MRNAVLARSIVVAVLTIVSGVSCTGNLSKVASDEPTFLISPYSVECHVDNGNNLNRPVRLIVLLRNISAEDQYASIHDMPQSLSLFLIKDGVEISRSPGAETGTITGQEREQTSPPDCGIVVSALPTWLKPGEHAAYKFDLTKEFQITENGKYTVVARYRCGTATRQVFIAGSAVFFIGEQGSDLASWHYP